MSRGLSTRTLPLGDRTFSIQFDFIDHQLVIRASDGEIRTLALRPQTVADFYREVMATLDTINRRMGRDTVFYAASGIRREWTMSASMKSPHFTTDWEELLKVPTATAPPRQ